ncbi:MAG: hypothetical protein O6939_07545 [Bacteroidetes bacterium]|nr:hypothetical protein [Bacteroidota bacterium]
MSNFKSKSISIENTKFVLDSLSIDPQSITVIHAGDTLHDWKYHLNSGELTIEASQLTDSLKIYYRVLPFSFTQKKFHRSLSVYDSNAFFKDPPVEHDYFIQQRNELFTSEGLEKSGSISRTISFGNNQDVFVNSQFNLQLDGRLTDNVNVRAVISDQNIPFQPEGNTQQLQEFDKVYIEFYNQHGSLRAGDVVLKNKESQFLRYYKNVQGGELTAKYNISQQSNAETTLAGSVAKGQFASIQLEVFEGVAGPYRLIGPNGERFVIVLANSEKVYLDGKLLKRGYNYDYTIDYNFGEITFTSKIIVTRFSRLRVDYEYSDQNYSRTIISGSHYQTISKFNFFTNYYTEKDNPNRSLAFDLSEQEIDQLSSIGDNLEMAVISGADSVKFDQNRILYKKVDTLDQDGNFQAIFKRSNNPDSAFYQVSFSDLGIGRGNYQLLFTTANGRIYEWISPQNGAPQGRYEPVTVIPTPNKKQMITVGTGYQVTDYEKVFGEWALSDQDLNRFSSLDSDDDQGQAVKVGFTSLGRPFGNTDYSIKGGLDFEFDEKNFNAIDRYRYIEFDRDWSFDSNDAGQRFNDNIFNFYMGFEKDPRNLFQYRFVNRKRGEDVNGFQHMIDAAQQMGRINVVSDVFFMKNDQQETRSDWMRLNINTFLDSKIFVPGYMYSIDRNKVRALATDSVLNTANNFRAHKFYIRNNDTLNTKFELNYSIREDKAPSSGELIRNTISKTTNLTTSSKLNKNNQLDVLFTYRILENFDANILPKNEETIMGRIDWISSMAKRHIRSELTYSSSNSRELKKEFVFIEVNPGEGTHTWRDDNGDGIQDLNEFYEALNVDERNYAKIFVPTDEYVLAFNNVFNYRLHLDMPRNWRGLSGIKKVLSRFSQSFSWNIDNKFTDDALSTRFIPFKKISQEDLLAKRESLRSTLFYNRSSSNYGFNGGIFTTENKQLLTNGFESRENQELHLEGRVNIGTVYNLQMRTRQFTVSNASDFLIARNYDIEGYELSPSLSWQPRSFFRLTGGYSYTFKQNQLNADSNENAILDEYSLDLRIVRALKSTFNTTFRYIQIDFQGQENTPVGYELLNALEPGDNFTWSINWQRRIANGLQLTLNYDGRKSPGNQTIHIGRMQVSALF